MQKTKLENKIMSNPVGVAPLGDPQNQNKKYNNVGAHPCVCPNSKGITLIALIITIIVMLILVGVTINVALNGGLFTKARQATKQTQIEIDREQLLSAVVASLDKNLQIPNAETLQNNLASGWSVTGEDIGPFTATSPNGNVFTVDKDGTITGQNGGTQTPGGDEPEDPEVPEEPETPTVTLPEELKVGKEFTMDADQDGTEETWIVLYDSTAEHLNENEIEVISKDTMGSLTLGADDTVAIENAIDLDGNDTVEDIEIAIYSYNNAIDRINNYCESLIKIGNLGVRSVGSLPSNPSYKNTSKPYAIQNLDKWTNQTAWNTYGVLGEDTDTNLNDDYTQMNTLGIMQSGNTKGYWLASRSVGGSWDASSSFGYVNFYVRNMSSSGNRGYYNLWSVYSSGSTNTANTAYAVRPVVKLQYP